LILTDIFSCPTVNIERIITKLVVWIGSFEEKTIWTKLFLRDISNTFIILVALFRVREETILLRAAEQDICILGDCQP